MPARKKPAGLRADGETPGNLSLIYSSPRKVEKRLLLVEGRADSSISGQQQGPTMDAEMIPTRKLGPPVFFSMLSGLEVLREKFSSLPHFPHL